MTREIRSSQIRSIGQLDINQDQKQKKKVKWNEIQVSNRNSIEPAMTNANATNLISRMEGFGFYVEVFSSWYFILLYSDEANNFSIDGKERKKAC